MARMADFKADDVEWKFYAVNSENKLVMGFEDNNECKEYAKKNRYKVYTRKGLINKKIDPYLDEFWSDSYQEF